MGDALSIHRRGLRAAFILLGLLPPLPCRSATITIDNGVTHQRWQGIGDALGNPLWYESGSGSSGLADSLRAKMIDIAFGQVRMNLGMAGTSLESPGDYLAQANDNDDPFVINWKGFQPWSLKTYRERILDFKGASGKTAKQLGYTGYFLGGNIPNVRWQSKWLNDVRAGDYGRFLDECAEQVLADLLWYRGAYRETPAYYMLGDEELSGNGILEGSQAQMVDVVGAVGRRLAKEGFGSVKFIIGTEESEQASLDLAKAVLADTAARRFVGAIGYHTYPYGSDYSSMAKVLAASGAGNPPPGAVTVRNQLRDLGRQFGVPVWITENSHGQVGGLDARGFDCLRARAIQIHDEMAYADIAAYFPQSFGYDLQSARDHSGNNDLSYADLQGGDDYVTTIDNYGGRVDLTMFGRAIGHYSRWIHPGAVRIDAKSDDPLVQVVAFRDASVDSLALVIINNKPGQEQVTINARGIAFPSQGKIRGEQSTSQTLWGAFAAGTVSPSSISLGVPGQSVTSMAVGTGGTTRTSRPGRAGKARAAGPTLYSSRGSRIKMNGQVQPRD